MVGRSKIPLSKQFKGRYCQHCGKELTRNVRANGQLEVPATYAKRKFCNPTCKKQSMAGKAADQQLEVRIAPEIDIFLRAARRIGGESSVVAGATSTGVCPTLRGD